MMKACRTVSVDENAHSLGPKAKAASMASTPSALGSSRSYQEGAASPWTGSETPKDRQRAASHETALHNSVSDRATRRANRRAKRKAFFRKLFFLPPSPEEDERSAGDDVHEPSVPTPPPSSKAVLKKSLVKGDAPADEGSAYKLDDGYYASMASILSQYKTDYASEFGDEYESVTEKEDYTDMSDLDSNTDMSEISVFDLEEDQTDDEGDAIDEVDESFEDGHEYALGPIPETELIEGSSSHDAARELMAHVSPPVRVPMEYTLADRRGGSCVGGRHVLFTSAAFKRKQRQMLYNMRSIHENEQFIVPQVQDEDEDDSDGELNTSGVYALQSEWI